MARLLCRLLDLLLFLALVGEWPIEIDSMLYSGLWRSPFGELGPLFAPLPGIRLFAWQVVLIALAPVCLFAPGAFRHRSTEMDTAIVVSFASIAVLMAWGVLRGGSAYMAYYQLWRFLTALLVALLLSSVVRSTADLRALAWIVLIAAIIRGTLVMYFYWVHVRGKVFPVPEYMINHDDSLLFVAAVLIMICWAIARGRTFAYVVAALVSMHQLYAVVLNDRRIAYVELAFGLLMTYVMIGRGPWRRRINRWAVAAAPVLLLYVAVGWGSQNPLFAPVQALATTGSHADSSSLARQEEVRNLLYTLSAVGNPLLGTGWGMPYHKVTSVFANYSADWVLAPYTPHNSLVGLAAFGGLVGVFGVWLVIPVGAYLATTGYRQSEDRVIRVAMMVTAGLLPAYAVHCFGDIGLQSFPCGLLLGSGLAVVSVGASRGNRRQVAPPRSAMGHDETARPATYVGPE